MGKKIQFLIGLLLLVMTAISQSIRTRFNFNRDWKFSLGDITGAAAINFDDTEWDAIGLPHSFSIPYFLSPDFYVGYGWYRKHFKVTSDDKRKRLFIEFEGAFQEAEIFVNSKKVGAHKGGYTGFSIDVTDAVKPGDNIIAVRLNNLWNPRLAPRAGEHVFSGGIYRDVYLVITDPVHVAWYGTFVTTPVVTGKEAIVNVKTEIKNDDIKIRNVKLKTDIFDPEGKLVGTLSSSKTITAGATVIFDQTSSSLANPKLWHPEHPFLYRAVSTVLDGNKPRDQYETNFGIRSIKWTADKGFFLNGGHYYLKGANVHQDHAGWGDAVTDAGVARDVRLIKDAGFNFIRGSHYPHDPSFAEACDNQGVLFWSENAFWGIGGSARTPEGYWNSSAYPTVETDRREFEASVKQQLSEMIRIFRNHPSIIAWSLSNEPFFTAAPTIAPMRELLQQSVDLAHTLDPTRPAAIGGAQRPLDDTRIDKIGDVAGYNGDGSSISVFQDPGVANVISEYGSTTADRPGKYEPGWGDLAKDSGQAIHPWRSGQAIWCGFDHGSIAGSQLGKMGMIDYFRIPKRAWYWYRNVYVHIPPPAWPEPGKPAKLQLEADKKIVTGTDGTDDVRLLVTVMDSLGKPVSNNPPVELNVVSGPGEFPTGPSIKFEQGSDIRIQDGQAAIEFRSYYAGETIIRATSPGLEPAEVHIRFSGPVAYVPGITHQAKQREYTRFTQKRQPAVVQQFGRNNPTFASSSDVNHPAGFAADGNRNTWWQAASGDTVPSLILDLEKSISLSDIRIYFPVEGIYHYKIDLSDDGLNWQPVIDLMQNETKETFRQIHPANAVTGRSVRISFKDAAEARIAELEVTGMMLDK